MPLELVPVEFTGIYVNGFPMIKLLPDIECIAIATHEYCDDYCYSEFDSEYHVREYEYDKLGLIRTLKPER